MAGGNAYNKGVEQAQEKGQQEQQNQQKEQQQQQQQSKGGIQQNSGSLGGNNRVTFDSAGNTLVNGKIVQFASQQARESYLSARGVGNTGQIVNAELFAKSNFGDLAGASKADTAPISEQGTKPSSDLKLGWESIGKEDFTRGSQLEQQRAKQEADRASKYYKSDSNSDYLTGGKKSQDDNIWHPPVGNVYKDMGQGINGVILVRGTKAEETAKSDQASKASVFYNSKKDQNADYITGGKPDNQGGVVTAQSKGKSFGYAWVNSQLGTKQLVRGSEQEKITAFESGKPGIPAKSFGTSFNVDLIGKKDNSGAVFQAAKTSQPQTQVIEASKPEPTEGQIALGQGLASLSAKQTKEKNLQNEKEFNSFVNEGVKNDAVFVFYSGNKQVGQTSGARSRYDILKAEKQYSDLQIGETYPAREQELTKAVQQNPTFYSGLSKPYWDALSKSGYFSKNNAGKIQTTLDLEAKTANRENLSLLQGSLFSEIHGGPIPTKTGVKNIGPAESEVASFLKFPFAGQKTSTSLVPSTSLANVAQFYPGIPVVDRLAGPASEVWINLIGKSGVKLGEAKNALTNKVKINIGERAISESYFNRPKEVTFAPRTVRQEATFRPTNPMREKLPLDLISKDTTVAEKLNPVSARQNEPRNTMFEDVSKETQARNTKIQNDLLTPRTPYNNPPASRNIPFFKGFKDQYGRLFSSNTQAIKDTVPIKQNEEVNLFGKTSSQAPVQVRSNPSETGLSPVSREFFGVQFKGAYPTSYLPPASGFVPTSTTRSVIDLEPQKDYQDWRFGQFLKKNASNPKFGFKLGPEKPIVNLEEKGDYLDWKFGQSQKRIVKTEPSALDILEKTLPTKAETLQNYPQLPGRSDEVLGKFEIKGGGYSGKVPIDVYKSSIGHSDINVNAKEFFGLAGEKVSKSSGKYSGNLPVNRYFEAQQGKREGDIAFFDRETGTVKREYVSPPVKTGRTGPLDILSSSDFGKSIFPNAKGAKYYKSEEVYPYGKSFIRGSLKTKDVGLAKFEKYQKEHREPEKVGDKRFDTFVAKLPKGNKKAAVFNNIVNPKEKSNFKASSAKLFETKPKEQPKKEFEFKNTGSKSETVLINKPLVRRRIITSTEQQYDTGYEFKPVPESKTENGIMSGIMSGLKTGVLPGYSIKSGSKLKSGSLLDNLNKNLTGIKPKTGQKQGPKQFNKLFTEQIPRQGSKQFTSPLQTPKQGTKPKQVTKLVPHMPTPQRSRVSTKPKFDQPPRVNLDQIIPPKKVLPFSILYGPYGKPGKAKSRSGPTALLNLNVNNIFSSSLSINVAKNKRVEF